MKISQLAALVDVASSKIRFYEQQGLLPKPKRQANRYRDYHEDLVPLIQFIQLSQNLGFSLDEIKPFVNYSTDLHQMALNSLIEKDQVVIDMIAELECKRQSISIIISHLRNKSPDEECIKPQQIIELLSQQSKSIKSA